MSRRVLLGKWPAGFAGSGYGLRVSKSGQDALTASDANLVFSSDWPAVLPILQKGSFSIAGNTSTSVSFTGPGYIPFVFFTVFPGAFSGAFAPLFTTNWNMYGSPMKYYDQVGNSYLRLRTTTTTIEAAYNLYLPSGDPQGWPNSFTVAYTVYRLSTG